VPAALLAQAALAQQGPAAAPAQTEPPRAQVQVPPSQAPAETKAPADSAAPAAAKAEAATPAAAAAPAEVQPEAKTPAETAAPAAAKTEATMPAAAAPADMKTEAKTPAPAAAKAEAKKPAEPKAQAKTPPKDSSKAGAKQQAKAPAQDRLPPMPPGSVGKGPLTLTSSAAVTYQEYFADACPRVLAVSAFGWATHAALGAPKDCPDGKASVDQAAVKGALGACNAAAYDLPCSILAVGRKILWDGPIGVLRGPHTPQGESQFSVVLRKVIGDGEPTPGFETVVGTATYAADGQSAALRFMTHDELGACRGSLRRHDGETGTVSLACTAAGAINGNFDSAADGRTGSGTASGSGERAYVLKVLPHTDIMDKGMVNNPSAPSAGTTKPEMGRQS
jgi:hypothetical protein